MIPLEVLSLYRSILTILGFIFFHMKLRILLSRSVKNCISILMEIDLICILLLVTWPCLLC